MKGLKYLLPLMLIITIPLVNFSYAENMVKVDVYLVYAGADNQLQKSINNALPETLQVKTYNASRLMMDDYSGKQKALAKVSSASVVVWISSEAQELMDNASFKQSLSLPPTIDESGSHLIAAEIVKLIVIMQNKKDTGDPK